MKTKVLLKVLLCWVKNQASLSTQDHVPEHHNGHILWHGTSTPARVERASTLSQGIGDSTSDCWKSSVPVLYSPPASHEWCFSTRVVLWVPSLWWNLFSSLMRFSSQWFLRCQNVASWARPPSQEAILTPGHPSCDSASATCWLHPAFGNLHKDAIFSWYVISEILIKVSWHLPHVELALRWKKKKNLLIQNILQGMILSGLISTVFTWI